MPISRRRVFRLLIVLLAAALIAASAAASIRQLRTLDSASGWLAHSYQVINLLEATEGALYAAEASARGYRIASRPAFRDRYYAAILSARENGRELVALTADHPTQQQRARAHEAAVLEQIQAIQILLDPPAVDALDTTTLNRRIDASLARVERIRTLGQEIADTETSLLHERRTRLEEETRYLGYAVASALATALALMAFFSWSLLRENRRTRALERQARSSTRDMADTLASMDRLSEQRHQMSRYVGLLQSCDTVPEIMHVSISVLQTLLPGVSGHCYLLRASQNFYASTAVFGDAVVSSTDSLVASQCWALRRGQPYHLPAGDPGLRCGHVDAEATLDDVSTLCVPLIAHGGTIGLLHVSGPRRGENDNDFDLVNQIAEQLSLAIANQQLRDTLRIQSLRDPLTGLFNRRYLEESFAREMQRCERRGLPLSVLMLDVDHFKRFNDTHGHAAGDALLALVGRLIQSSVRADDIACRYGGEEFLVVMPELDASAACARAEDIRRAVGTATVQHAGRVLGPVTISVGVATFPDDGITPELVQQIADATLYRAKAEGRDRVLHASYAG